MNNKTTQGITGKQLVLAIFIITILVSGVFFFEKGKSVLLDFRWYYLKAWFANVQGGHDVASPSHIKARSVPALLYHSIVSGSDAENISFDNFLDQMKVLHEAGYRTISVQDFDRYMDGEIDLPEKSFLLTFDDGAKDSYYPVHPILKKLGLRATTFIISRFSILMNNHPYYLSSTKLKSMVQSGVWDIQSHGRDDHVFYDVSEDGKEGHFLSDRLWLQKEKRLETVAEYTQRVKDDLRLSKEDFESKLGIKVFYFAYPFGDYGHNSTNFSSSTDILKEEVPKVYKRAFYQAWEGGEFTQNYPERNSFMLKRIGVSPQWTGKDLLSVLENGSAKSLPYSDNFADNKGWQVTWGGVEVRDSNLQLRASQDTSGGTTFLDGTASWSDYVFEASIDWRKGKTASLIARFGDWANYISCNFDGRNAIIEERVGNKGKTLAQGTEEKEAHKHPFLAAVRVRGNMMECLVEGRVVTKAEIHSAFVRGGIGFKAWDPQDNNSEIVVRELKVTPIE